MEYFTSLWISLFGLHEWIFSDTGLAFVSEFWKESMNIMKIKHHLCEVAQHTGIAIVERANRSLFHITSLFLSEHRIQ